MRVGQRPFLSFVEKKREDRFPSSLKSICDSGDIGISGSELQSVRLNASAVGSWWICSVEGRGLTRIENNALFEIPDDFALLTLSRSGQYQSSAQHPLLSGANTLSLSPLGAFEPIISWGDFAYTIFCIPKTELAVRREGRDIPYGRSITASSGPGALLAAALRTLCAEALYLPDTAILVPLLSELSGLIIASFSDDNSIARHARPVQPIDNAVQYLEDHFTDPTLCPKNVAAACGMSERQLYRHFSTRGESFSLTLRRLRLERGARFLSADNRRSIIQIAQECGFSTPLYFSQSFRDYYGVSPREYRTRTHE